MTASCVVLGLLWLSLIALPDVCRHLQGNDRTRSLLSQHPPVCGTQAAITIVTTIQSVFNNHAKAHHLFF